MGAFHSSLSKALLIEEILSDHLDIQLVYYDQLIDQ